MEKVNIPTRRIVISLLILQVAVYHHVLSANDNLVNSNLCGPFRGLFGDRGSG